MNFEIAVKVAVFYVTGTTVKQADVILLGFPFMWPMPNSVRLKDLEVYEKVRCIIYFSVIKMGTQSSEIAAVKEVELLGASWFSCCYELFLACNKETHQESLVIS